MSLVRPPRFAVAVLALAVAGFAGAFAVSSAMRGDVRVPSGAPAQASAAKVAQPALSAVSPLPGLRAQPAKPLPPRRRTPAATAGPAAQPYPDQGGDGQFAPQSQDTSSATAPEQAPTSSAPAEAPAQSAPAPSQSSGGSSNFFDSSG